MPKFLVAAPVCVDYLEPDGVRFGGALYSARAAAAFGFEVGIIGSVGADEATPVLQLLNSEGIDPAFLKIVASSRTLAIANPDEVLEQHTHVVSEGECEAPAELDSALAGAAAVLTYGHCLNLAHAVLDSAPAGVLSAVDIQDLTDPAEASSLMAKATWTLISEPSAWELTERESTSGIIGGLWDRGARNIVLKLGPGGALVVSSEGDVIKIPAYLGPYRDTVGAGDVFNAIFLGEIMSGVPLATAGDMASRAASYFISSADCSFGGRDDLHRQQSLRIPIYAPPEVRGGTYLFVLSSGASDDIIAWVDDILLAHNFSYEWGEISTFNADLTPQHLVLVIIGEDGATESEFLARVDRRASLIVFTHSPNHQFLHSRATVSVSRGKDLLMCLYAFSAGGNVKLVELVNILHPTGTYV